MRKPMFCYFALLQKIVFLLILICPANNTPISSASVETRDKQIANKSHIGEWNHLKEPLEHRQNRIKRDIEGTDSSPNTNEELENRINEVESESVQTEPDVAIQPSDSIPAVHENQLNTENDVQSVPSTIDESDQVSNGDNELSTSEVDKSMPNELPENESYNVDVRDASQDSAASSAETVDQSSDDVIGQETRNQNSGRDNPNSLNDYADQTSGEGTDQSLTTNADTSDGAEDAGIQSPPEPLASEENPNPAAVDLIEAESHIAGLPEANQQSFGEASFDEANTAPDSNNDSVPPLELDNNQPDLSQLEQAYESSLETGREYDASQSSTAEHEPDTNSAPDAIDMVPENKQTDDAESSDQTSHQPSVESEASETDDSEGIQTQVQSENREDTEELMQQPPNVESFDGSHELTGATEEENSSQLETENQDSALHAVPSVEESSKQINIDAEIPSAHESVSQENLGEPTSVGSESGTISESESPVDTQDNTQTAETHETDSQSSGQDYYQPVLNHVNPLDENDELKTENNQDISARQQLENEVNPEEAAQQQPEDLGEDTSQAATETGIAVTTPSVDPSNANHGESDNADSESTFNEQTAAEGRVPEEAPTVIEPDNASELEKQDEVTENKEPSEAQDNDEQNVNQGLQSSSKEGESNPSYIETSHDSSQEVPVQTELENEVNTVDSSQQQSQDQSEGTAQKEADSSSQFPYESNNNADSTSLSGEGNAEADNAAAAAAETTNSEQTHPEDSVPEPPPTGPELESSMETEDDRKAQESEPNQETLDNGSQSSDQNSLVNQPNANEETTPRNEVQEERPEWQNPYVSETVDHFPSDVEPEQPSEQDLTDGVVEVEDPSVLGSEDYNIPPRESTPELPSTKDETDVNPQPSVVGPEVSPDDQSSDYYAREPDQPASSSTDSGHETQPEESQGSSSDHSNATPDEGREPSEQHLRDGVVEVEDPSVLGSEDYNIPPRESTPELPSTKDETDVNPQPSVVGPEVSPDDQSSDYYAREPDQPASSSTDSGHETQPEESQGSSSDHSNATPDEGREPDTSSPEELYQPEWTNNENPYQNPTDHITEHGEGGSSSNESDKDESEDENGSTQVEKETDLNNPSGPTEERSSPGNEFDLGDTSSEDQRNFEEIENAQEKTSEKKENSSDRVRSGVWMSLFTIVLLVLDPVRL